MAEEDRTARAMGELADRGVDDPTFIARFGAFCQEVLDHMAHEERDEFPLLRRYLPVQRLHTMAHDLRDVQTMD